MISELTLGIAVILMTGLLFGKVAKFIKVPNVTGYLIGGLVIGPVLTNLIIPRFAGVIGFDLLDTLALVADIELGFIAFTIASEFKVSYFKQVGAMPVVVAFAEPLAAIVITTLGILLVGIPFGIPFEFALALAAVGGATAPAATIMVMRQYRAKGPLSKAILSVVAIDDISSLIYFGISIAIVKAMANPGQGVLMTVLTPFIEIVGSLGFGAGLGFLLTWLMKPFSSKGNRIVLVVTLVFISLGVTIWLQTAYELTFSSLLICMAAGVVFTNTSKHVEEVMPLVEFITPPLVILFFVLAGASLQFGEVGGIGIGLCILLVVSYLLFRISGKVSGAYVSLKLCKADPTIQKWLGFSLLPQGGIAIGLATLAAVALPKSENYQIYNGELIRAIVLLSIFVSEIAGPVICKYALAKAGEIQVEPRRKKRVTATAIPPTTPDQNQD